MQARWLVVCLVALTACQSLAFTVEDDRDSSVRFPLQTHRIIPAHPAMVLLETGEWAEQEMEDMDQALVDPMKKAMLGQQVSNTDVGVKDPVTEDAFKGLKLDVSPGHNPIFDFFPWKQPKKKFMGATEAQTSGQIGRGVKPALNRASEQLADPSTIHRECPHKRCPANVKCSDPTHTCCGTGNFTMCCPGGSTCLNTDPPSCLMEPADDPKACTTEECAVGHHCPLSKQFACCKGGMMCCPSNAKCSLDNPPKCKLLTHWEMLTLKPPSPQSVVKSDGMNAPNAKYFTRQPIKLVAIVATKAPTTAPTGAPSPLPTAQPTTAPLTLADQCAICKVSLFPDRASEVGVRSREKSEIHGSTRITITEVQRTTRMRDGSLRTKTNRHRTVTNLVSGEKRLWPEDESGVNMANAIYRLHQAEAHPTKAEKKAAALAPFTKATKGSNTAVLTKPSTIKHTKKVLTTQAKAVDNIVTASQTVAKQLEQRAKVTGDKKQIAAVKATNKELLKTVAKAAKTAQLAGKVVKTTALNNVVVAKNAAKAAKAVAKKVHKKLGVKKAQKLINKVRDNRKNRKIKVPIKGAGLAVQVKIPRAKKVKAKFKGVKRVKRRKRRAYVGGAKKAVRKTGKYKKKKKGNKATRKYLSKVLKKGKTASSLQKSLPKLKKPLHKMTVRRRKALLKALVHHHIHRLMSKRRTSSRRRRSSSRRRRSSHSSSRRRRTRKRRRRRSGWGRW